MSAVATKCMCCGDDCGKAASFDVTLGTLCTDCAYGVRDGKRAMRKAGIEFVYLGPCGDNLKGGES